MEKYDKMEEENEKKFLMEKWYSDIYLCILMEG